MVWTGAVFWNDSKSMCGSIVTLRACRAGFSSTISRSFASLNLSSPERTILVLKSVSNCGRRVSSPSSRRSCWYAPMRSLHSLSLSSSASAHSSSLCQCREGASHRRAPRGLTVLASACDVLREISLPDLKSSSELTLTLEECAKLQRLLLARGQAVDCGSLDLELTQCGSIPDLTLPTATNLTKLVLRRCPSLQRIAFSVTDAKAPLSSQRLRIEVNQGSSFERLSAPKGSKCTSFVFELRNCKSADLTLPTLSACTDLFALRLAHCKRLKSFSFYPDASPGCACKTFRLGVVRKKGLSELGLGRFRATDDISIHVSNCRLVQDLERPFSQSMYSVSWSTSSKSHGEVVSIVGVVDLIVSSRPAHGSS
eukprot:g29126.t1